MMGDSRTRDGQHTRLRGEEEEVCGVGSNFSFIYKATHLVIPQPPRLFARTKVEDKVMIIEGAKSFLR